MRVKRGDGIDVICRCGCYLTDLGEVAVHTRNGYLVERGNWVIQHFFEILNLMMGYYNIWVFYL
jgi:hypothetical protein